LNDDRNDHDAVTETSVDTDASSTEQPTVTVTGITLTGEALAAAASAGLLPADVEPSTLEARLVMPADSEPSTIEPTLGVRALAGTAVVAVPSSPEEEEEERTTLNIESRLLGAFEQVSPPPPVKHLPSTSTTPKKKVSKSPTMKGMGVLLPPIPAPPPQIERQQAPSDPTLDDENSDATIDRPPPSRAAKGPAKEARAAPPVEEPIGEDDVEEQTAISSRQLLVAIEVDDDETSVDASLLSGGLNLSAVAAAASAVEADRDDDDDEIATSVRLEAAPLTLLSSSDLVTDAGPLPDQRTAQSEGAGESERERTLAMKQARTAPAPFPISAHVRVADPAPAQIEDAPLEPRGQKGTVKVVADGTGSTPIAYSDLPGRWPPVPSAADPTMLARRPRRRGRTVVLLALLACIGAFVFVRRVQSKAALIGLAASLAAPAASSDSPPRQSASASVVTATSATADPNDDVGAQAATATAAAPPPTGTAAASSAPEPAKARVTPPHKPPPVWRPAGKPAPSPPTPAPKASAWTPLHI
jgi:hypothetical protein